MFSIACEAQNLKQQRHKPVDLFSASKRYFRLVSALMLCFVLTARSNPAKATGETDGDVPLEKGHRIVVLHSYHAGFSWSDKCSEGILQEVNRHAEPIDVCFEFLDTQRIASPGYLKSFEKLLLAKYKNRPVDVVICCADQALEFITSSEEGIFPGVPVVFCNTTSFDGRLAEKRPANGLTRQLSIKETLETALKLQPSTRKIYVILDSDLAGQALKEESKEVFADFSSNLEFIFLEDLSLKELQQKTLRLPSNSIVFLFIFKNKTDGKVLPSEKHLKLLKPYCPVPIYSVWEFYLGHGIVGGKLACGKEEGKMVAQRALRVLEGAKVSEIPLAKSPTRFAFDYKELKAFDIPLSKLPPGSKIINNPFSLIKEYSTVVIVAALIFLTLGASVAILTASALMRKRSINALKASESKYSRLFNKSSDAIIIHDLEGNITDVNERALELLGYEKDETLKLKIDDLHPENALEESKQAFDIIKESGSVTFRVDMQKKDGKIFHAHVSAGTFRSNSHMLVQGIIRDISEQKEYEQALAESELKYRTLIETLPHAIAIIQDRKIVFANPALLHMLKADSQDKALGLNFLDTVSGTDKQKVINYARARKKGRVDEAPNHYFLTLKRLNGESFPAEIFANRIEYKQKPATQVVAIDISRLRANQAERARLASAVEQAAECIMITDPHGIVKYVNPCFEEMTGYSVNEVVGHTPQIVSSGKHSKAFYDNLWQRISSGKTWRGNFVNRKKDGTLFEEEAVISPVMDNAGNIVNYVAVKRNVSYERLLENQIRHSQKMAAMGHLAHRITHTFTNALTRIIGNAQIAQSKVDKSSDIAPNLQEVVQAAKEVTGLAAELLAFAHPSPPKMRNIDLNRIIDGLEEILGKTLSPDINLKLEPAAGKHKINADPSQLEQALTHLAINSMEAMPKGGTLTITTQVEALSAEEIAAIQAGMPENRRHHGGFGAIIVSDTGCGMPEDVLAHAFEPFFTTKTVDKSVGLGLSTADRIISQHGGQIIINSQPDAGTTAKIYLPLSDKDTDK